MEVKLQRMIKDGKEEAVLELLDENETWCKYRVSLEKVETYLDDDYTGLIEELSIDDISHILMCEANECYPCGDVSPSECFDMYFELEQLIDSIANGEHCSALTKTVFAIARKYKDKWI